MSLGAVGELFAWTLHGHCMDLRPQPSERPPCGPKVITVEAALKGFETSGLGVETAALLDELDATSMFWK